MIQTKFLHYKYDEQKKRCMCKYKKIAKVSIRPFGPMMSHPYIVLWHFFCRRISHRNPQCRALTGSSSRANSACCFYFELLQFFREEVVCKVPLSGLKVQYGGWTAMCWRQLYRQYKTYACLLLVFCLFVFQVIRSVFTWKLQQLLQKLEVRSNSGRIDKSDLIRLNLSCLQFKLRVNI